MSRGAQVIHSGLDSDEVARTYPVDLAVVAGINATVKAVLEEVRGRDLSKLVVEDRKRHVEEYHAGRLRSASRLKIASWRCHTNSGAAGKMTMWVNPKPTTMAVATHSVLVMRLR